MRILKTPSEVKRCLERSGDWYQPATTTSFLRIGSHHRTFSQEEPFGPGFIDAVDESMELRRRLQCLDPRDREILVLWHVLGLPPGEVARRVGISRRHCFRRRTAAIEEVVKLGDQDR